MSLDFYLKNPEKTVKHCIHCNSKYETEEEVFSLNITHNLGEMASQAWIYEALWHPDSLWVTKAKELVQILKTGLKKLKEDPEHYKKFNASNWWGTYEYFVPFVESVMNACIQYPEALVFTST